MPAAGKDERRVVFGVLQYASGRLVWRLAERKGGDAFAAFLKLITRIWPDEDLVVVTDDVSYHRAPAVRSW